MKLFTSNVHRVFFVLTARNFGIYKSMFHKRNCSEKSVVYDEFHHVINIPITEKHKKAFFAKYQ